MLHRDPSMTGMSTVFTISHAHKASVVHAAFDPQGEVLATGSGDETVRMWRILERPRRTSRSFEVDSMNNNQILR
jgi:WD40 repeat protein